jgi:hypothetical protein
MGVRARVRRIKVYRYEGWRVKSGFQGSAVRVEGSLGVILSAAGVILSAAGVILSAAKDHAGEVIIFVNVRFATSS